MGKFPEQCIKAIRYAKDSREWPPFSFELVHGKNEDYWYAKYIVNGSLVEIYVYENEAGYMIDGYKWSPFERPDFESDGALIRAFVSHIVNL